MSSAPADRLRALVEAATPGPWRYSPDSDEHIVFAPSSQTSHCAGHGETPADTRLIALAPSLAVLLADAMEALEEWNETRRFRNEKGERTHALLARFDALVTEETP